MNTQTKQAKHTPGPWRYCMFADHLPDYVIKTGNRRLAKVNMFAANPENSYNRDVAEGEANARLIAAAPELLSACERMMVGLLKQSTPTCEWYEGIEYDGAEEARSAIAKARGEA